LISPMFYKQLTRAQIPKAQKDTDDLTVFLRFWDLHTLKLCVKMLVKSATGGVMPNVFLVFSRSSL